MHRRRDRRAPSTTPPQTTRARLRGEFIKRAKERKRDYTVDWVHLKLNDQAQRTVLCKDPFKSRDERVEKLIASLCSRRPMPSFRTGAVVDARSKRAPGCSASRSTSATAERAYVLTAAHRAGRGRATDVVVNTTAVDLGLGTGGWHVVHWNLDARRVERARPGPHHEAAATRACRPTPAAPRSTSTALADVDHRRHAGRGVQRCTASSPAVAAAFKRRAPGRARSPT